MITLLLTLLPLASAPAASSSAAWETLSVQPKTVVAGMQPHIAAAQDDEAVKDFKKYFRKVTEPAARTEAVLTLLGVEHPSVVDALLPVLRDKDPDVVRAAARVLSGFESRPPIDRLIEVFAGSKKDEEQLGLLAAMRAGGYSGLGEAVLEVLTSKSWELRRSATLALAAGGDASVAPLLVPLAADKEPAVRCAVIDSLAALGAPETLEVARAQLADETWQVRSSAILALGRVRHKDSIPLLIQRLGEEEGRLVVDVGNALDSITGRTFGTRLELWTRFWETYADRYEIPSDEELTKLREAQARTKAQYSIQNSASFHGVETPSRAILFVIDVSGSMEDLVVEKERFEGGHYPSWARMDIVKTELANTIESLESYVEFGIISFATETDRWKKKLVPANVINKESALDYVRRLEPLGGNSKIDLAEVGLGGSANLGAGKTNTYGALSLALGLEDEKGKPNDEYLGDVDTIFFLSDGRPTHGKYIEQKEILERVTEANSIRKIALHTIAIGNFDKVFMSSLAKLNGGVFVDLGK